jgi:hypothetical protein
MAIVFPGHEAVDGLKGAETVPRGEPVSTSARQVCCCDHRNVARGSCETVGTMLE